MNTHKDVRTYSESYIWMNGRKLQIIPADKINDFIKEANKNVLSEEFLRSCRIASGICSRSQK